VTNCEDSEDKIKLHQKKEVKLWEATTIFGRKYNQTHALPQQRSTLVRKKHEGEKSCDYGKAEADP
jgi:hypothetical protein